MHHSIGEFFKSPSLWSAFGGWLVASVMKMMVNLCRTGKVDFQYMTSLAGMPSAHSAMVSGLATSVGLQEGFGSTTFVFALAFAVVVMFDASIVRRATGQQARLLNQIANEFLTEHRLSNEHLRDLLGHSRLEVFVGILVGAGVGLAINLLS